MVVEKRGGATVDLRADLYWILDTDEMFSVERVPAPNAGLLSDDLEELAAMAASPDDLLVPWHDLKHLIGLLEALVRLDLT